MKKHLKDSGVKLLVEVFRILAVVLLAASFANSQALKQEWIRFSPPNKSFTVELPGLPSQSTKIAELKPENETDVASYMFKCTTSVTSYILPSILKPDRARFQILHVNVSRCERDDSDFAKDIFGFLIIFGGDDHSILSEKPVTINGFHGKDIVFKNGTQILMRTLAINIGKELFFVSYNRIEGDLVEEERIFRTFKPSSIK